MATLVQTYTQKSRVVFWICHQLDASSSSSSSSSSLQFLSQDMNLTRSISTRKEICSRFARWNIWRLVNQFAFITEWTVFSLTYIRTAATWYNGHQSIARSSSCVGTLLAISVETFECCILWRHQHPVFMLEIHQYFTEIVLVLYNKRICFVSDGTRLSTYHWKNKTHTV